MFEDAKAVRMKLMKARLRGIRRGLRALTIWHPYGRAYTNLHWWRQLFTAGFVPQEVGKGRYPREAISLIVTCDLELDPPWQTRSWEQRTFRGLKEGLPRLLDLLDAYKIRGTFFTEGLLAHSSPESVVEVAQRGHEVGCHGLTHESYGGSYRIDETVPHPPTLQGAAAKEIAIRMAKNMLEELIGVQIRSFRAPFLHIDSECSAAVANTGFLVDSSLQNGLFGYLSAPSHLDPGRPLLRPRGNLPPHRLIEIPVSVDTQPRLRWHRPFGSVDQGLQTRSVLERIIASSALAGVTPTLVFLVHPWEFVEGFTNPFGVMYGPARAERFQRLLDSVAEMAPVRATTMGALASEWEHSGCPWHADDVRGQSFRSEGRGG